MPEFLGRFKSRISIAAFLVSGRGLIAGLLITNPDGDLYLEDSSASLPWPPWLEAPKTLPAWVALDVTGAKQANLCFVQPLDHVSRSFSQRLDRRQRDRQRLLIIQQIRRFFINADFLEVDTPVAVPNPGMEPYLDTFPVGNLWLRTSPELHMKQLLGLGHDRIFQMGPCFRKGDIGSMHREEFHMLEWYRCFADLDDIIADVKNLLHDLAPLAEDPAYFERPATVVSCSQLFREMLGLELSEDIEPLRQAVRERGLSLDADDDWDTLYFQLFLNFIEPHLGKHQPTIVTDYPASQAALAKLAPPQPGELPTCFRFELYIKGIELANAFYELTDAEEQRQRFIADNQTRKELGKATYPMDSDFLDTLARNLPPTAGIALGVDRLVAAVMGYHKLDEVLPFPAP